MNKIVLLLIFTLLFGCSRTREIVQENRTGNATIGIALREPDLKIRATTHSLIHVTVHAENGTLICDTTANSEKEICFLTIPGIKEGTGYVATAWSEDESGDTIHAPQIQLFDIAANENSSVTFQLHSICGSIIIELAEVPTSVDSLFAVFAADSGTFKAAKKRSSRIFLSLDKIPYGAKGTLRLTTVNSSQEIISTWDTLLTFTNQHISGEFSLVNNGELIAEISVDAPANTIFSGLGDTTSSLESETGDLIISEFCATGGSGSRSCEFIEIYNPRSTSFSTDTLFIEVGDKTIKLPDITVQPDEYLVVSTTAGSFWNPDRIASLDISSTSGLITLTSEEKLLDYVLFFNDSDANWKQLSSSSRTSWVLNSKYLNCSTNNSGLFWEAATSIVVDTDGENWYGSPGVCGR